MSSAKSTPKPSVTELRSATHRPLISIVYHSGSGHTAEMAHAVAQGASSCGEVAVAEHRIVDADFKGSRWLNEEVLRQLDESDAIILGSPTYMGSVSAQLKAFMDATSSRCAQRKWVDKIAAAFTVSAHASGDKLAMLMACSVFAMQHGMFWVGVAEGSSLGIFFGAGGRAIHEPPSEMPSAEDKMTGELLGRRVAKLTARLHSSTDPSTVENAICCARAARRERSRDRRRCRHGVVDRSVPRA